MKRLILLFALAVSAATVTSAQISESIGLFSDAEGTDCTFGTGVLELHVIHYGHGGATSSEFAVEFDPSWSYLGETWDFAAIGNAVAGVTVSYGGCLSAPTHLGVVSLFDYGAPPCSEVGVGPAPGNIGIVSTDCSGGVDYLGGSPILTNCGPCGVHPPYALQPADGTTGVSLEPTLSWSWDEPTGCVEGIGLTVYTVLMGTDPDNLTEAGWADTEKSMTVGLLEPSTLYYWQVEVWDDFYNCPGERTRYSVVQSFTTAGPVPVEQTTWGRIKQLYR